jgi:hypothetical protein
MYACQTLRRTARAATIFGLVVTANGIPGFAQQWFRVTDQEGLISVSREVTLPADETEFIVAATARVDVPREAAIDALQGVGISASNLSALRVENPVVRRWIPGTTLAPNGALWVLQFNLVAPAGRTAEIVQKLNALQKKPPEQLVELRYLSRGSASAKSVADARARILPEIIGEARRKAEQLALSAGQAMAESVGFVSEPAPEGDRLVLPCSSDPLNGVRFLGNDTHATFSVSLRFGK